MDDMVGKIELPTRTGILIFNRDDYDGDRQHRIASQSDEWAWVVWEMVLLLGQIVNNEAPEKYKTKKPTVLAEILLADVNAMLDRAGLDLNDATTHIL